MNYQITSDNMEVTPSMEILTKDKFVRIEHRLRDIADDTKYARIVLNTAPEESFMVKAHVVANGKEYFSQSTDYSLEGALIKVCEELVVELDKSKQINMHENHRLEATVVEDSLKSE